MNKFRKILSVLFALTLLTGLLSVSALAVTGNTVTINSKTSGHTYQAYQVFAGDYADTNVLSNVTWGTGVDDAALLAALKADSAFGTGAANEFFSCSTAEAVAGVLSGKDTAFADKFAKVVAENLSATHTDSGAPTGTNPYVYKINGLADGYYFINESSFGGTVDNAYTKFILQVVDNVTVDAKTDSPSVAKKVMENNDTTYADTWNDAADYSIGDAVPFRIVGLVPNMSNYTSYSYMFTDTLSGGLSFNPGSLKVYYATGANMYAVETSTATGAGGTELTTGYSLGYTAGASFFTLSFTDLKTTGVAAGGYIVIEYTATLNSSAVIGNPGNPNEVKLTYSNNPNGEGTGETPKDEVVAFTFRLPVNKTDGTNALSGATFALFKTAADADAAVADPTALANALKFTGSAGVYTYNPSGTTQVLTDNAGAYAIKGLDQGIYYLVEIDEPTGYNRLTASVPITIAPSYDIAKYVDGHLLDAENDQLLSVTVNESSSITVVNKSGSTLPETGGIGTTIFTGGGLVLMLCAGVLFTTKRKMSSQQDK